MEWNGYGHEIAEVIGLRGSPVGITYSMDPPPGAPAGGKLRVCEAFRRATDGETIDLTAKTSACQGGTSNPGLGERPTGERDRALKEFLVHGEKLYCSIATFHRAQSLGTPPPLGLAEHVVVAPLDGAELRPDVALFICNAEQACRLLTLDGYDTGIPPRIEMSGATCHQAVADPVATGELNVSLTDYTSRRIRGYGAEDLLVSIPYHRLHGVMRSIDHCTAGRAKTEIPEAFRRLIGPEALRDLADQ